MAWKNIKYTIYLRTFALWRIPLIFFCNPRIIRLDEECCEVLIPLSLQTKNHWRSMYFGALCVGADLAGGIFATFKAEQKKQKVSLLFKDFKANFLKRAEGDVVFRCKDGELIEDLLAHIAATGERTNRTLRVEARVPRLNNELVATFELGLSLKPR